MVKRCLFCERHLYGVEGLSQRQMAKILGISRIIWGDRVSKAPSNFILKPYERLIEEAEDRGHPSHREKLLKATPNFKYQTDEGNG